METIGLFLLWWLFGCGRGGGESAAPPLLPALPGGQPGWPGSPITFTPPWPQQPGSGLPPFPGTSWEFDEPPPAAVQQRARQLVDELWARGSGTYRIEQTAGRWIAYQAQIVASGKRGVVAYRQKAPAALPASATASRAPRAAPRKRIPSPPVPTPVAAKPQPQPAVRVSPVSLPTLVRGAGIKPKPPSPNVRILQQRLGIAEDGQFGSVTEEAVRAFQRSHGLKVDGIVGDKTWAALFAGARA